MNDDPRWTLYRDADMRARLTESRLWLTPPRPHWWAVVRVAAGWSYGGTLHVWAVCSHARRRPVGPRFVRAVQAQIAAKTRQFHGPVNSP